MEKRLLHKGDIVSIIDDASGSEISGEVRNIVTTEDDSEGTAVIWTKYTHIYVDPVTLKGKTIFGPCTVRIIKKTRKSRCSKCKARNQRRNFCSNCGARLK